MSRTVTQTPEPRAIPVAKVWSGYGVHWDRKTGSQARKRPRVIQAYRIAHLARAADRRTP
jgi:hypothetical protein